MKPVSLLLNMMNMSTKAIKVIIIIANLYTRMHTCGSGIHAKTWVVWITPPCWNPIHQLF